MSYTLRNSFNMGPAYTGKSLRGQIVDDAGANVGSAITTAAELTGGKGVFEQIVTIQDGQTGFLRIYFSDAPTVFLASIPLNPQEIENADTKTSTVASAVSALPSAATIASAVWASGSRTLTSFGTLVADIWAYATRTLTSGAFSAASVWDYLTSSISTTGSIGKLLTDRIDASISSVAAIVAAQNPDSVDGATLNMRRAVTYDGTISGLSAIIPVAWTKAIFTMKAGTWLPDSQAIIQVQVSNPSSGSDGLILLNGASSTPANASLSVNQGAGTVTIHIEDDALAAVTADSYTYDVKFYYGTSDSVATTPATCTVNDVVTQTV